MDEGMEAVSFQESLDSEMYFKGLVNTVLGAVDGVVGSSGISGEKSLNSEMYLKNLLNNVLEDGPLDPEKYLRGLVDDMVEDGSLDPEMYLRKLVNKAVEDGSMDTERYFKGLVDRVVEDGSSDTERYFKRLVDNVVEDAVESVEEEIRLKRTASLEAFFKKLLNKTVDKAVSNPDKTAAYAEFLDLDKFSKLLVDKNIDKSASLIDAGNLLELVIDDANQDRYYYKEIDWPTIMEFNMELGKDKIKEFNNMWIKEKGDWYFCVDYLSNVEDQCSDYYMYEVKWSRPTSMYPIPQAVASVFFTIDVSKVKPQICPVIVTYVFESSRFIHTPGKINFQEKWLSDIIQKKLNFYKTVTF